MWHLRKRTMNTLIKTFNNDGERTPPCLTPEVTANAYEKLLAQRTLTNNLPYQLHSFSTSDSGSRRPILYKHLNNLSWCKLSNAFLISKEARKTKISILLKYETTVFSAKTVHPTPRLKPNWKSSTTNTSSNRANTRLSKTLETMGISVTAR